MLTRIGQAGCALLVMLALAGAGPASAQGEPPPARPAQQADQGTQPAPPPQSAPRTRGRVTGLPVPRFVSLKAAKANVRRGPSLSHRIDWVFTRRGMPLEVVGEFGHWRRVRDRDGVGGWVHYSLITGTRTGIIEADMTPLHARPDTRSPVKARLEAGVIARLEECRPQWCRVRAGGYKGWLSREALWGLLPGEVFD